MRSENNKNTDNDSDMAKKTPPTAFVSEIMNLENPVNMLWPFIGGVAIGATSVIATVLMTDALAGGAYQPVEKRAVEPTRVGDRKFCEQRE